MALAAESIDEEMAADWATIKEKYAEEPPELPEKAVEPEPVKDPPTDRARDEGGRFAKTEAKEPLAKEPAAEPASAPPSGTDSAQAPERDLKRAPSTWKPTARAEYEKLPDAVKLEIHRREQDFMNGQSQLLPDAKFGKDVRQVVEPYRMLIESEGGTPERAIGDLMRTAAIFRVGTPQQKTQALVGIAKRFNVDLSPLLPQKDGQPAPQGQNFQDPRVDQLLARMNQQEGQRAQAEQAQLESSVTRWMEEKDAGGNPARPYLGDVMTDMSALVPAIRQANPSFTHEQVLQQAYERATWGNPEIRTLLSNQEVERNRQTREAENQNRVREAKRAASVNVPRRASIPSAGKPGTMEETLTDTARTLGLIS